MAAIAHGSQVETTQQTHTGDTNWTTKVTVDSSNFVANGKYLIICTAQGGGDDQNDLFGWRLAHGSTPTVFLGSEHIVEPYYSSANDHSSFGYMTVWTQPGTAEDIVFQLWTNDDANTVRADDIVISWMRLDADLVEGTDYKFAEVDDSGSPPELDVDPTWTSKASVTFTPTTGDDWLIIGNMRVLAASVSYEIGMRLTNGSDVAPMIMMEPEDAAETGSNLLFRVWENLSGSQTFTVQGTEEAAQANALHHSSRIFALRLDSFKDHASFWNEGTVAADTSWTEVGNLDFTPTTTADFLILGGIVHDASVIDTYSQLRLQLGGTTIPSGANDALRTSHSNDTTDEVPSVRSALATSLSGSQDLDMDVYSGQAYGEWEDRSIAVVSMELAAAAAPTVYPTVVSVSIAALSAAIAVGEVILTPAVVGLNITALDAAVSVTTTVGAQLATSTLTGLDATIAVGEVVLTPSVTGITLSALDAVIVPGGVTVSASLATATLSTLDATTSVSVNVAAALATIIASALDATIVPGEVIVSPAAISTTVSCLDASIVAGEVVLSPVAVDMTLTALDATVSTGTTVAPAVVSMTIAALDAAVVAGEVTVTPAAVTATIMALDAAVAAGIIVSAEIATATITALDATIVAGEVTVTPSAISITVTALDAVANAAITITAQLATATLTAQDATISATVTVSVSVVTVNLTALPATILPGPITVSPGVVGLLASALDATVNIGGIPGYVTISDCAAFNAVIADIATGGVTLVDAATAAVTITDEPQ